MHFYKPGTKIFDPPLMGTKTSDTYMDRHFYKPEAKIFDQTATLQTAAKMLRGRTVDLRGEPCMLHGSDILPGPLQLKLLEGK